jgi:toxin ParE2
MHVRFHRLARDEMIDAALYYDSRTPGLGDRFLTAVEDALESLKSFPESGAPSNAGTRTRLVRKFPFGVVYQIHADEIYIVAVAHLSRRPDYWVDRLGQTQ